VSDLAPAIPSAGAGSLTVAHLEEGSREWDRFVARSEEGTFCHLAGWREIMADVLSHQTRYLVAKDGEGEWQGVLPLVRVRSRIFGHYLLSMPFMSYGGPLGTSAAQARLTEEAVEQARQWGVDLLELRARHPVPADLPTSHRKITVLVPLPETTEQLWKGTFKAKLRSQIRRPMKEGMEARFGADQVGPFYEVFSRHMRDLGTPVLPRRFFEQIARTFADQVIFGAVYLGEQPTAAGCGFLWGDEFELTWASALREHSRSAPNMLFYASCMEEVIRRGGRVFNFGRCTPGAGTHRFKLQWGGVETPLPWAQWSPREIDATPSPESPLFRIATTAWQRLPLAVANRLGPLLARQLP
jgi:FemAB-related protein (PEP-CTERM system-associated)